MAGMNSGIQDRGKPKGPKRNPMGRGPGKGGKRRPPSQQHSANRPPILDVNDTEPEEIPPSNGPELAIVDLKAMAMPELVEVARQLNIEGYSGLKKQDLIFGEKKFKKQAVKKSYR